MIDILIPVYYRAHQIPRLYENIKGATRSFNKLHFIVERDDKKSVEQVLMLPDANLISGNFDSYCNALNTGYFLTYSEFLFTGVDDLEMEQDWDVPVIKKLRMRPELSVIGSKCIGADVPPEGQFTSYFTIRRSFIQKNSLVAGMPNLLFYPYYHHEADRELYGRAKDFGVYDKCEESVIHHCQVYDEVQKKTVGMDEKDRATYWGRRHLFRGA